MPVHRLCLRILGSRVVSRLNRHEEHLKPCSTPKASNLIAMRLAGLPVPPMEVLDLAALERLVCQNGTGPLLHGATHLALRPSYGDEDSETITNAGNYTSYLNIPNDRVAVVDVIRKILDEYRAVAGKHDPVGRQGACHLTQDDHCAAYPVSYFTSFQ